ncbi:hypothetical protein K523DRAFT_362063 [Schizophyllum commune Tattone D]|nr:hypothetical protein K523DRAFT_362063 [Schizophyllum commune Tattone D]
MYYKARFDPFLCLSDVYTTEHLVESRNVEKSIMRCIRDMQYRALGAHSCAAAAQLPRRCRATTAEVPRNCCATAAHSRAAPAALLRGTRCTLALVPRATALSPHTLLDRLPKLTKCRKAFSTILRSHKIQAKSPSWCLAARQKAGGRWYRELTKDKETPYNWPRGRGGTWGAKGRRRLKISARMSSARQAASPLLSCAPWVYLSTQQALKVKGIPKETPRFVASSSHLSKPRMSSKEGGADTKRTVIHFKKLVMSRTDPSMQDHRNIYTVFESHVKPNKELVAKNIPPIEVYIYAIKDILHPDVDYEALPSLLDLLSSLEALRKFTLDHAKKMLVWHDYYKKIGQHEGQYSKEDLARLRSITNPDTEKTLRELYMYLICTCCQVIVYRTWTSAKKGSDVVADTLVQLNSLFPELNADYRASSPRLFLADLSEEERRKVEECGADAYDWIRESIAWLQARAGDQTTHCSPDGARSASLEAVMPMVTICPSSARFIGMPRDKAPPSNKLKRKHSVEQLAPVKVPKLKDYYSVKDDPTQQRPNELDAGYIAMPVIIFGGGLSWWEEEAREQREKERKRKERRLLQPSKSFHQIVKQNRNLNVRLAAEVRFAPNGVGAKRPLERTASISAIPNLGVPIQTTVPVPRQRSAERPPYILALDDNVLASIFNYVISDRRVDDVDATDVHKNPRWILQHVCSRFRNIMLANPAFFAHVRITYEMAQQRAGLLEYYLALSQDLPLDVYMAGAKDYVLISGFPFQQEMRFEWTTSKTPFKSVALVWAEAHRWRSLVVLQDECVPADGPLPTCFPLLERITIRNNAGFPVEMHAPKLDEESQHGRPVSIQEDLPPYRLPWSLKWRTEKHWETAGRREATIADWCEGKRWACPKGEENKYANPARAYEVEFYAF